MKPNVTTVSAAADRKRCGRNTIYRAIRDGRLNTAEVGNQRMVLLDEAFERFTPKNRGARAARQQQNADDE